MTPSPHHGLTLPCPPREHTDLHLHPLASHPFVSRQQNASDHSRVPIHDSANLAITANLQTVSIRFFASAPDASNQTTNSLPPSSLVYGSPFTLLSASLSPLEKPPDRQSQQTPCVIVHCPADSTRWSHPRHTADYHSLAKAVSSQSSSTACLCPYFFPMLRSLALRRATLPRCSFCSCFHEGWARFPKVGGWLRVGDRAGPPIGH